MPARDATPLPILCVPMADDLRRRLAAAMPRPSPRLVRTAGRLGRLLLLAYWAGCLAVIGSGAAKLSGLTVPARAIIQVPKDGFSGCREAQAAGAGTLYFWEPGYRPGMDGDGDGRACERNTPRHLWSRLEVS